MIYRALRWISGIMLHWFYSEISVEGAELIPRSGPMLVAVNHPNAMVDSLVAGWAVPRRLRLTAKATLLNHPVIALLFKMIGVVPLSRASDHDAAAASDRTRNRAAFDQIIHVLHNGGSVQIFPEGRSNSDSLMPLKTGLARIALEARRRGVRSLSILPIGLAFENKAVPGTRVRVRIAPPVNVDSWPGDSARELTAEVASRLGAVSTAVIFPREDERQPESTKNVFIRIASWWGRTTHEIPVRYARALAVARSRDADEPAMLTMLFGIALVLVSYVIHITIVGLLTRSVLLSALYLATLVTGAYWTAFEPHRR